MVSLQIKVETEKESTDTAPEWRILTHGFNVESVCQNVNCLAFNKPEWIQIGFGSFNPQLLSKLPQYKCPLCNQKPQDAYKNPGFADCKYFIEGEFIPEGKKNTERLEKNGLISGNKFLKYDENDNGKCSWLTLKIETSPL